MLFLEMQEIKGQSFLGLELTYVVNKAEVCLSRRFFFLIAVLMNRWILKFVLW